MRGSSNVRKYLAAVKATPAEGNSEYSLDYRASAIDTLEWMLGEAKERPILLAGAKAKPAKEPNPKPKRMRAPRPSKVARPFSKDRQVQA